MDKETKRTWLEALRSGKYTQCKGELRRRAVKGGYAYCALAVAKVLHHGAAKYGARNWLKIPVDDHLSHAMVHIFADLAGDEQDDHLEHAACRILMALELAIEAGDKRRELRKP